jgi:hypothetical protein
LQSLPEEAARNGKLSQWHRFHAIGDGVSLAPGIDDGEALEAKVGKRVADRGRHPWGIGTLAFDAEERAAAVEHEVDLRTLMGRPERSFVVWLGGEDLFDCKAFPRCRQLRMPEERRMVVDAQQLVQPGDRAVAARSSASRRERWMTGTSRPNHEKAKRRLGFAWSRLDSAGL